MRFFYLFFTSILFISCNFFNSIEIIEVKVPDHHYQLLEKFNFYWNLEYRDYSGQITNRVFNSSIETIYLEVEKGLNQSYLLSPVLLLKDSKSVQLNPAGLVYPHCISNDKDLKFDWELGFEANINLIICQYLDPDLINLKRLFFEIEQISQSQNHWIIDEESIIENLPIGEFKIYDIRKKRERTIRFYVPSGEWFNQNLMGDNFQSISNEVETEIKIYTGVSLFISNDGRILEINMEKNGEFEYLFY